VENQQGQGLQAAAHHLLCLNKVLLEQSPAHVSVLSLETAVILQQQK
jgi:hypothetical protein